MVMRTAGIPFVSTVVAILWLGGACGVAERSADPQQTSIGGGGQFPALFWFEGATCDEALNELITLTRDSQGRPLLELWQTDLGSEPQCTMWGYDEEGNQTFHQLGCGGASGCITTRTSYDEEGIERTERDQDCDGVPDQCEARSADFALFDMGCDGAPDVCTTYTHDGDNVTYTERDEGCDGMPESCSRIERGSHGFIVSTEDDVDCDGDPDENCLSYEYDDDRKLLKTRADFDCDGEFDEPCWDADLDEDSAIQGYFDEGCDGVPDYCSVVFEGPHGEELSAWDDGCDLTADRVCRIAELDAQGNTTRFQLDIDCDGTPDQACSLQSYNEDGDLLRAVTDEDCDGFAERCTDYAYE